MNNIVLFGPGPKFKGGIANYNTSLAKALANHSGFDIHIVSWTQQYPAIIPRDFIDRKSRKDLLEGTQIKVNYLTNYNNPATWRKTVKYIESLKPAYVIFQWSIAIQGLPLGYMAKKLSRKGIKVIFDLHFVIQKEGSTLDKRFTRMALKHVPDFVVHSYKTADELSVLFPDRKFEVIDRNQEFSQPNNRVIKLFHPVYDMFQKDTDFNVEAEKNQVGLKKNVFLFFGFIRKYKGLHHAIQAFAKLTEKRDDVSLYIVGESFWQTLDNRKLSAKLKKALFGVAKSLFLKKSDDEQHYRPLELIKELGIEDNVKVYNEFVPNEDVHKYFQVSDAILLFYLTATPSGVESMACNFNLPILATRTGHFPETVKDGYNGYLAEVNDPASMAATMEKAITRPILRENVAETSKDMSWANYANAIVEKF